MAQNRNFTTKLNWFEFGKFRQFAVRELDMCPGFIPNDLALFLTLFFAIYKVIQKEGR